MIRFQPVLRCLAAGVAAALLASQASAVDIITRKSSEKRLGGKITTVTKTAVVIKTGLRQDKTEKVPANDIVKIEWDGAPRTLNGLLNAEEGGRLKDAYDGYAELLKETGVTNDNLRADLKFYMARATAKMALADPEKIPSAIKALTDFRAAHPDSYHYYELLGLLSDLQLAAKSYDDAKTTLAAMKAAPWKDVQLDAACSEARVLLAQNKPQQALTVYDTVLKQAGADPSLTRLKNRAGLGKAAALQQTNRHDEALKELDGVIKRTSPDQTALMAEAYLLRGDSLRQKGASKDALLAYLHVDVLFAKETKFHPKALYYLSQLWAEVGQTVRAGTAKSRLTNEYPNSEWAKK